MSFQKWQQKTKHQVVLNCAILIEPFHILTITLLSLLLPLSFLLLARLSTALSLSNFTFNNTTNPLPQPLSLIFSLLVCTNPTLIHLLVSIVCIATLVHGLTGKITLVSDSPGLGSRPRLFTSWIFLCTLQVCVGLGIEGSIAAGIDGVSLGNDERSLCSRVIFFLGLHETMLHWSRTVVRPVVDDTVFGGLREEKWVEKVAMAASFGGLWWWRLRNEVESLVIVAEVKKELSLGVGVADFVGWWLYYLTVTIGMVRIVKGLMWVGMVLVCWRCRRVEQSPPANTGNEDKVERLWILCRVQHTFGGPNDV